VVDRLRDGGWAGVALYLGIALATLVVLIVLLHKINPVHLTIGALMVMVMYLAVAAFMILGSRIFVSAEPPKKRE
jgi:uncharacterized membrane protein YkgB